MNKDNTLSTPNGNILKLQMPSHLRRLFSKEHLKG